MTSTETIEQMLATPAPQIVTPPQPMPHAMEGALTTPAGSRALEQLEQIEGWLDDLELLGIDIEEHLPRPAADLERYRELQAMRATYLRGLTGAADPASDLANTSKPLPPLNKLIDTLDRAAAAADDAHRSRVADTLERAANAAARSAWAAFRRERGRLLDLIRPAHDRAVTDVVTAWAALPDCIITLEQAAVHGYAEQWLALEPAVDKYNEIVALVEEWMTAGLIGDRDQNTIMRTHRDWDAYLTAQYKASVPARVGVALTTADPALLSDQEVEALGSFPEPEPWADKIDNAKHQSALDATARAKLPNLRNKKR